MKRWLSILGFYAVWRAWLVALAFFAQKYIPFVSTFTPHNNFGLHLPWWQWVWANFDGVVFLVIARSGYTASEVPFFPLYPLMVRFTKYLTALPYLQSGLLVSTLAFLVGLWFVWKLLVREKKSSLLTLVLLLILCFPTAYHYTAVYNDSLFFALATMTLYYAREKKYWLAGLLGGLATLARLNGLALFFVLLAEYFFSFLDKKNLWNFQFWFDAFQKSVHPRQIIKSGVLFAGLIPLAFLGYLAFIDKTFGDWNLFFTGVEVWHRSKLTFPLQTFWRYVKILLVSPRITFVYIVALFEALFTLMYLGILFFSWKKIHPTFWIMMFFHWLIPVLTGTLQGMPRYGLHLFPMYFCLALWLEKKPRWIQGLVFLIFLSLQIFYVSYFTRGYFVT